MPDSRRSLWDASRLIDLFGGLHGVGDKGTVEAAVFRPQTGYYRSLEEEASER